LVGGFTPADIEFNKELAERAGDAVRGALLEGVVPGGGVALLNCQARRQATAAAGKDP